jgi:hypothetical protein
MSAPRLKRPPIQVPFDKDGNMMEDYRPWMKNSTVKDNYEFYDTLRFVKFIFARAGTKFIFQGESNGKKYYVFQTEMEKMIPLMKFGVITGRFTFVKRSTAFGLKMVIE